LVPVGEERQLKGKSISGRIYIKLRKKGVLFELLQNQLCIGFFCKPGGEGGLACPDVTFYDDIIIQNSKIKNS
jgi:hypothetical protein